MDGKTWGLILLGLLALVLIMVLVNVNKKATACSADLMTISKGYNNLVQNSGLSPALLAPIIKFQNSDLQVLTLDPSSGLLST